MTRSEWLRQAAECLLHVRFDNVRYAAESAVRADGSIGIDSPQLSAKLLLCHVLQISREQLAAHPETAIPTNLLARVNGLLHRRAEGEPLAYLTGEREFFGRALAVSPFVLIPRPETETLIDAALDMLHVPHLVFADMGTGSGCLALTLCAERSGWQGIALEKSARALQIADRNIRHYNLKSRILPVLGDYYVPCLAPHALDLVIANPPYVSLAEYAQLSPEVQDFEPVTALVPAFQDDGGRSNEERHLGTEVEEAAMALADLQAVARAAEFSLKPRGLLLMEHGWNQDAAVHAILENGRWESIRHLPDLAGINRAVCARRTVF